MSPFDFWFLRIKPPVGPAALVGAAVARPGAWGPLARSVTSRRPLPVALEYGRAPVSNRPLQGAQAAPPSRWQATPHAFGVFCLYVAGGRGMLPQCLRPVSLNPQQADASVRLLLQPDCPWILFECENINHLTMNPVGFFVCLFLMCIGYYNNQVAFLGTFLVKNLLRHKQIWPL